MVIQAEDNDSYILGEESLEIRSPDIKRYKRWMIAMNGQPHPRVCTDCGAVLQRTPICEVKLRRRDLDLGVTGDGYYVVSRNLLGYLRDYLQVVDSHPIPNHEGFEVLAHWCLPVLEVDQEQSGTRESPLCPSCEKPYYQLFGRIPGRPPRIRELVFQKKPESGRLYRSDMEFGTTHGRSPVLIAHPDEEIRLQARGFKGLSLS